MLGEARREVLKVAAQQLWGDDFPSTEVLVWVAGWILDAQRQGFRASLA